MASGSLGDLIVRVGADISGFAAGMTSVSGKLSAVDKEAQKAGAGFTKLGGTLTGIGMGISTAVTLPILGAGLAATKFASDFELGMRQVTSLIGGATQREFADLSAATLKLAKDLGIDAVKATNALYEAISAGIPKENALEFVKVASVSAIAGLTDAKVAVNALTTVIAAYGLKTTEAKELSDAMFQAVNIGKFQFADLAAEIGPAAQMSSALGVSYQELLAATATLSITTGSAGKAVTQIESAMRSLLNPTAEMSDAFEAIGVTSGSAAIKAFGFEGTLQKLRVATGGNVEAFTQLFGRIEGSQGALGLTGEKAATAAKDLDTMRHASDGLGASTVAYNEINKSTSRQLEITLNNLKSTAIEMGTSLLPAVNSLLNASKPLLEALADMVSWFAKLPSGVQSTAIGMAAMAAAIGPLVIVAGQTSIAIGGIVKAASLLGPTLKLAGTGLSGLLGAVIPTTAALSAMAVPLAALAIVFAASWGIDKFLTNIERFDDSVKEAEIKTEALRISQLSAGESTGKLSGAFDGAIPHNIRYAESLGMSTEAADRFYERWKGLDDAIGAGTVDFLLAAKVVDDYNASVAGLPEELRKAHDEQVKANAALKQGAAAVTPLTSGTIDLAGALGNMTGSYYKSQDALRKQNEALKAGKPIMLDLSILFGKVSTATKTSGVEYETAAKKAKRLKDEEKALKDELEKLSWAMENDVKNLKYWKEKQDEVAAASKALAKQEKDLNAEMLELARTMPIVSAEAQELLGKLGTPDVFDAAGRNVTKITEAYKTLGVTVTTADLEKKADELGAAYMELAAQAVPDVYAMEQAWVNYQEAIKKAKLAVGEWTPAMEEALQSSKTTLAAMEGHIEPLKNKWTELGKTISGSVTNAILGMERALIDWDWQGFKDSTIGMFKEIGLAVLDSFIKPARDAIATFISTTITDLLSGKGLGGVLQNIKDIGSTLAGVFSGGASATGGVASTAAGAGSSAAGGVGSAVAGVAGSAASAWVGAIGAVGSMVSGIIGNFQQSTTNDQLKAIETNIRYLWILMDGSIKQWVRETAERLGWGGGPLSSINDRALKLYDIMDGMDRMEILVRDNIVPDLRAIRDGGNSPSVVVTVQGNVIGNSEFIDQIAVAVVGKLQLAGAPA